MKNIYEPHVREIHITQDCKLRLRVNGINQVIDILSFIATSLKTVRSALPEIEMKFNKSECGGVEEVKVSYIQKQKQEYKDVYIIKLLPQLRTATTVICNEDDVDNIGKRLKQLIHRFELEIKKKMERGISCPVTGQMLGRVRLAKERKTLFNPPGVINDQR